MVTRLEALIDSIGRLNGIGNPDSDAYQIRSPLLVKSFARAGKHETDSMGRRVFNSLLSGYKAGWFDVKLKIEGKSRAGLTPQDPLTSLLAVYGIKELGGIDNVVAFLRRALKDQSITKNTPLSYFTADTKPEEQ